MIGQVLQDVSIVHGGMAIRDLDVAPAFERREHHEQVGGAVALVLVIDTGRTPRFHRHRPARLGDELLYLAYIFISMNSRSADR